MRKSAIFPKEGQYKEVWDSVALANGYRVPQKPPALLRKNPTQPQPPVGARLGGVFFKDFLLERPTNPTKQATNKATSPTLKPRALELKRRRPSGRGEMQKQSKSPILQSLGQMTLLKGNITKEKYSKISKIKKEA